jgi:CTP synthase (UTP-ammonia lyase)
MVKIALVGDYNETVPAHQAIPKALQIASQALDSTIDFEWIPTDKIQDFSRLAGFDGIWCVPGSPYKNMSGALLAIEYAREKKIPFLGTCGGFQHTIIEYARHVMGLQHAEHAETSPHAEQIVISRLACTLVEVQKPITLIAGTKITEAYGATSIIEGYHCNYGLDPTFEKALEADKKSSLRVSARDDTNEVRAVELTNHPFFVATLFQHERAALKNQLPPLVMAFVKAAKIQ